SLAAAAWVGAKLAYRLPEDRAMIDSLHGFASQQLSWILGCNPYSMCFMYGFGKNNVPYMHSLFGHGSEKGGISNGITGAAEQADGSGISYREKDNGNEWRWTEQWLPHAAWFLQAITAMAKP
ncbi:MAG: glycoside hydrolase family 9 protein, partial [Bacteroidetes bacterium]|nr:glycoside hydrolase family 9 protein [Bacteroidota bacterium]